MTLPSPGAPSAAYLVDLPAMVHRHFHGRPPTLVRGERVEVVQGVASDLRRIVAERRPAYLAVAVEGKRDAEPVTWREELLPAYKAARKAKPRPAELLDQERRARELVEALGILVLEAPGFDGDDALAAGTACAVAAGLRVVIVGRDKDLMQLVGDDVALWDLQRDRVFDAAGVLAEHGVEPARLGDLLALTGDAGDGVPGVPGIGPGRAAALVAQHRSLERLLRSAGSVRGKAGEALRTHRADVVLARKVVTLRTDAPIRFDLQAMSIGFADGTLARHLLERAAAHTSGLFWGPKRPPPAEVLERAAAWQPARASAEIAAAWAALDAAIADRDNKPENITQAFAPALDPVAPAASWRDAVAWPAPAEEELRATPVGRWELLAGRWALLARAAPEAPTVLVRVLGDTAPTPVAERGLDSRPRSRVEVWCGGACQGEHEVPNRVVESYVTDDLAAMMRGNCPAAPDGSSAAPEEAPTAPAPTPSRVTTSGQVGFGW